jgi:hypothetical protein
MPIWSPASQSIVDPWALNEQLAATQGLATSAGFTAKAPRILRPRS